MRYAIRMKVIQYNMVLHARVAKVNCPAIVPADRPSLSYPRTLSYRLVTHLRLVIKRFPLPLSFSFTSSGFSSGLSRRCSFPFPLCSFPLRTRFPLWTIHRWEILDVVYPAGVFVQPEPSGWSVHRRLSTAIPLQLFPSMISGRAVSGCRTWLVGVRRGQRSGHLGLCDLRRGSEAGCGRQCRCGGGGGRREVGELVHRYWP